MISMNISNCISPNAGFAASSFDSSDCPNKIFLFGPLLEEGRCRYKNKKKIINTDADNCQTFSWLFGGFTCRSMQAVLLSRLIV
jgi:hypothetical protein